MIKIVLLFIASLFLGLIAFFLVRLLITNQTVQTIISPKSQSKFSLASAPSSSLNAQTISFSGDVLWQSRIANTPSKMVGLETFQQGEEIDTQKTGTISLSFPAVATIHIFPLSTLEIIQTLPANVVMQQKQGEIEYNVLSTTIPFSVRGFDLLTNITGDSDISVDTSMVTVLVKSGNAVLAYNDTNDISKVVTLKSGQKAIFDNDTKVLHIL